VIERTVGAVVDVLLVSVPAIEVFLHTALAS
jgi:hypothetical protein